MRTENVDAQNETEAYDLAPWAATVRPVDDGNGGVAYMAFESVQDARVWDNQR